MYLAEYARRVVFKSGKSASIRAARGTSRSIRFLTARLC